MVLYLNENVLNESVSREEVENAIENRQGVLITYKGENNEHTGVRYIEPYVYGETSRNNQAIRAYQYYGDTKKGVPAWKMLRLDRIESWKPTGNHFDLEPQARGWAAEAFNGNDKHFPIIYKVVDLTSEQPQTDLEKLRARTQSIKQNKPVNISDINQVKQKQNGPVGTNKPEVGTPNVEQPTRNTDTPLNSNGTPKNNATQPPIKQEPKQNGPVVGDATNPHENKPDELMSNDQFRDMLKRNLELTQKEKAKRNVDLRGNILQNNK